MGTGRVGGRVVEEMVKGCKMLEDRSSRALVYNIVTIVNNYVLYS